MNESRIIIVKKWIDIDQSLLTRFRSRDDSSWFTKNKCWLMIYSFESQSIKLSVMKSKFKFVVLYIWVWFLIIISVYTRCSATRDEYDWRSTFLSFDFNKIRSQNTSISQVFILSRKYNKILENQEFSKIIFTFMSLLNRRLST